MGSPGGAVVKNMPANAGDTKIQAQSLGWEDPWSRIWQPAPVFLPGKFHGQRSLAGYSPRGPKESDTIEHTCTHLVMTGPQSLDMNSQKPL